MEIAASSLLTVSSEMLWNLLLVGQIYPVMSQNDIWELTTSKDTTKSWGPIDLFSNKKKMSFHLNPP